MIAAEFHFQPSEIMSMDAEALRFWVERLKEVNEMRKEAARG